MPETTSFWPFTIKRPKWQEQRDESQMHCRAEKWEEDLINFKNLSNPFHSQSRRRAEESWILDHCFNSEHKVRWVFNCFFLLSPFAILCFIFFPLLKLQESITVASILPSVQSVDPSVLPSVLSVDSSVLPTDWPIGSSHRYVSLLFYFSVRLTHREYMFFPPYYDPLLFAGSFSSFSTVLSWIKIGFSRYWGGRNWSLI